MYKVFIVFSASALFICSAQILEVKCNETQFQCDDRSCLDSELKCDGAINCADGSDEDFLTCRTNECRIDQFHCAYGACVSENATCDGVKDCADNSDELLHRCRNEKTLWECINHIFFNLRDGIYVDHISATDECYLKDRTCKDGQVIEKDKMCDGKVECNDKSDETLETCASFWCGIRKFRCRYGACVSTSLMCNGVPDCADGSDELEKLCPTNNNSLCVLPTFPSNGYYVVSDLPNAQPGQALEAVQLNYSCNSGYKLDGAQSPDCTKGLWSDNPPECFPQCQLNKHPSVEYLCLPNNSNSQDDARECENLVENGTVVQPKCRGPNYYYSGVLTNMHCTDGAWDQVTVCSPQCGLENSEGTVRCKSNSGEEQLPSGDERDADDYSSQEVVPPTSANAHLYNFFAGIFKDEEYSKQYF